MSPRPWSRPLAVLLVVAAVVVGCTGDGDESPSPTPSPTPDAVEVDEGERIAVVIGPPTRVPAGEAAALEAAAAALELDSPGLQDVAEVRVLRATSDAFVADLVDLVVTDGYDVVCVVGTGTAQLLDAVARIHRATRFCGTDGAIITPPANVTVVGLDVLGLAELAAAAVTGAPSPVALVAGSTVGLLETVESAFAGALGPGPVVAPPSPSPTPSPSTSTGPTVAPSDEPGSDTGAASQAPADDSTGPTASTAPSDQPSTTDAASPTPSPSVTPPVPPSARVLGVASEGAQVTSSVVEPLTAAGPSVVVLLAPGAAEAGRALAETGASLVVVSAWATDEEGQLPPGVLVAVDVDWALSLRAAIVAARGETDAGVQLLGLADGIFGVTGGGATGADAAVVRAQQLLSSSVAP